MTTSTVFAVFEDFNDRRDGATPLTSDADTGAADELGAMREAAWTDGYLAGRHEAGSGSGERLLTAKLLTSVHDLDATTSEVVGDAALIVADLLVKTVIAATSDNWSARLMDRVQMVADRVKPALSVAPRFVLRDEHGSEQQFGDISDLSRVLEAGGGEDVTIQWHRGEATISRLALLEDLRDAIIPLSAGRADESNIRNPT